MKDEKGFTFIEILLVISIIAILLAVAITSFLGVRARGQDSAAKIILKNSAVAAEVYYTKNQSYEPFDQANPPGLKQSLKSEASIDLLNDDEDAALANDNKVSIQGLMTSSYTDLRTTSASGQEFTYTKLVGTITP